MGKTLKNIFVCFLPNPVISVLRRSNLDFTIKGYECVRCDGIEGATFISEEIALREIEKG